MNTISHILKKMNQSQPKYKRTNNEYNDNTTQNQRKQPSAFNVHGKSPSAHPRCHTSPLLLDLNEHPLVIIIANEPVHGEMVSRTDSVVVQLLESFQPTFHKQIGLTQGQRTLIGSFKCSLLLQPPSYDPETLHFHHVPRDGTMDEVRHRNRGGPADPELAMNENPVCFGLAIVSC